MYILDRRGWMTVAAVNRLFPAEPTGFAKQVMEALRLKGLVTRTWALPGKGRAYCYALNPEGERVLKESSELLHELHTHYIHHAHKTQSKLSRLPRHRDSNKPTLPF